MAYDVLDIANKLLLKAECENGGELIWNNELKTITLKTDKTDKYTYKPFTRIGMDRVQT